MAAIYAYLVRSGTWDLEDVPTLWRDEVAALLDK